MENVVTVQALHTNVIVKRIDNKFIKKVTASGILLPNGGNYSSQETGQLENDLMEVVALAEVISRGDKCMYLEVGDLCYLDTRSLRPIPFNGLHYEQTNEMNIICKVTIPKE